MAYTGVLALGTLCSSANVGKSRVSRKTISSCIDCYSSTSEQVSVEQPFKYSRASPSVRWPHLKFKENNASDTQYHTSPVTLIESNEHPHAQSHSRDDFTKIQDLDSEKTPETLGNLNPEETLELESSSEALGRHSRNRVKKMNKVALKRAKDWRQRVQFLTDRILKLQPSEFVADVLDDRKVQLTPTDFCYVVKWVGHESWHRALEIYEWLNLRHWYTPSPRMLATILAVLGRANQEMIAEEIFNRAEQEIGNVVQVYNAMMGVYARHGRFRKVQELLHLMRSRGCEPDLVSFNTLINAQGKSGFITSGSALGLLYEVRRSGLRPDIITYNTLISACSSGFNLEEAVEVYHDMQSHGCQPDLWTYNAMISVYGRSGNTEEAELVLKELVERGFFPDAVTYNSLLYAFARDGNVQKVDGVCKEMVEAGFKRRQTDLRPSMREFSVTHSLNSSGPRSKFFQTLAQIQTQTLGSCSSHFRTPCVFILFSGSFSNQAIHTHEYRAFQFRRNGDNGFFESKSLDIVNIGPAFRSHYNVFSPNSSFPWLSSETRGLEEEMGDNFRDTARKSLNQLRTESTDGTLLNQGLDLCAEGFSVGRLSRLMGPEATNYTSELEDLYKKMLLKLELLARQVEKSSYQVLDQENRNIKLRCKLGGLE